VSVVPLDRVVASVRRCPRQGLSGATWRSYADGSVAPWYCQRCPSCLSVRRRASVAAALDDGVSSLQAGEVSPGRWYLVTLTPPARVLDVDGLVAWRARANAAAVKLTAAVGGRAVAVHEATVRWEEPTLVLNPWFGVQGVGRLGGASTLPAMHWHVHVLLRAPYLCVSVEASAKPGHKLRSSGLPPVWWDYVPELLLSADGLGVDVQVMAEGDGAAAAYVAKAYVSKVSTVKDRDDGWSVEQGLLADTFALQAWRGALGKPRMVASYGKRGPAYRPLVKAPIHPPGEPSARQPRVMLGTHRDTWVAVDDGGDWRDASVRRSAFAVVAVRVPAGPPEGRSLVRRERLTALLALSIAEARRWRADRGRCQPHWVRPLTWYRPAGQVGLSSIRKYVARCRHGAKALRARDGGPDTSPAYAGETLYADLPGGGRVGVWRGVVVWRDGRSLDKVLTRLHWRCLACGWYTAARNLWSLAHGIAPYLHSPG
jgi:hypothetical protein